MTAKRRCFRRHPVGVLEEVVSSRIPVESVGFIQYRTGIDQRMFIHVLRIRVRSDPAFLGHPDPDPEKYRIQILYPQKDTGNSNFLVI